MKKYQPFTLSELLTTGADTLQAQGTWETLNNDERAELDADVLANSERWAEAVSAYEALPRAPWPTKEKLAYCLFRSGENARALAVFFEGPASQSPSAHCIHIYCLLDGKQWVPDDIRPQVKQLLAAALAEIDRAPPAAFHLLNILFGSGCEDVEQRQLWLTKAIVSYPKSQEVLEAYANLALAHQFEPLERVRERLVSTIRDNSDPNFVWLAYKVALRAESKDAGGLLTMLRGRADPRNNRWLSLAVAEEYFKIECWSVADEVYVQVEREGPDLRSYDGNEQQDWEIVLVASRGRLAIALAMSDDAQLAQRAVDFASYARKAPDEWRYVDSGILGNCARPFWVDGAVFDYQTSFSLLPHWVKVLSFAPDPDVRGLLRLMQAQTQRNEDGEFTTEGAEQIDLAAQELTHPVLGEALYEVARQRGAWMAAGEALTRFEIFRESEKALFGSSIYSGILDGEKKKHIREFTKGFRTVINETSSQEDLATATTLYDEVLRKPLLEHKLHEELLQLLTDLKARGAPGIGFDYGLANDLLGRHDLAKEAYWSLAPDLPEAAVKNLLRIAQIQRSDMEMVHLDQLINTNLETAEGERRQELEILLQHIAAARTKLSQDPVVVRKAMISAELARYPRTAQVGDLSELSFEEALTLISLFRACGDLQQDLTLEPFGRAETPFAPDSHDCQGIFALMGKGVISVSPDTSDDAFSTGNNEVGYFLPRVRWAMTAEALDIVGEIENAAATGQWPDHWFVEAPEVIFSFAISECLSYMAQCASDRQLQAPQGPKTRLAIANVLRDFSVSQAYAFIWRCAVNANDYLSREKVPKSQAANSIVSRLQTMADRARAEEWDVKGYGRSKGCARSQMSYSLFDMFLKVGERGFRECLGNMILPNGGSVLPVIA